MTRRRLWIRADGSAAIGLGHVMRGIAVAEAARQSAEIKFVMAPDTVASRIPERRSFPVTTIESSLDSSWLDGVAPGDAVLFDVRRHGPDDHAIAADRGAAVGAFDDFGHGSFDVDVLVHPDDAAPSYETRPDTTCLFGPGFAPIRDELVRRRRTRSGPARRLLVTLGGSDAAGITWPAITELARRSEFPAVTLLIGPAAPSNADDRPAWLEVIRDPDDVGEVFDQADAAVATAGTTAWELACMGVPTVLIPVAPDQVTLARIAEQAGAAVALSGPSSLGAELVPSLERLVARRERERMSEAGLRLVDGKGGQRVVDALFEKAAAKQGT